MNNNVSAVNPNFGNRINLKSGKKVIKDIPFNRTGEKVSQEVNAAEYKKPWWCGVFSDPEVLQALSLAIIPIALLIGGLYEKWADANAIDDIIVTVGGVSENANETIDANPETCAYWNA